MSSIWGKALFVCGALAILGGCAEEREPISRVQPNALKKDFFVGAMLQDPSDDPEFYGAATPAA